LPGGIPSHDTFQRMIGLLDPGELNRVLYSIFQHLQINSNGALIAIDGKSLRGSKDKSVRPHPLMMVTAWCQQNRMTFGQLAVPDGSCEMETIPELLKILEIAGSIVSIDAAGCYEATMQQVIERGADFVITVKDNQPGLCSAIESAFTPSGEQLGDGPLAKSVRHLKQVIHNRGRQESREYFIMPVPELISGLKKWRHIKSIGMVIRHTVLAAGSTRGSATYDACSIRPLVKTFAQAVRGRWSIENTLHWTLDVTFDEDSSRLHSGTIPLSTAMRRRTALSILQQDTLLKGTLKGKRKQAGWSSQQLETLLAGFFNKSHA
jgi:predicted transposase YbfD/YdcC